MNRFTAVDALLEEAITSKQIPGAVLLIGHNGEVVYKKAYGYRSLEPTSERMTVNTIFDVASLTKVVATTPSVLKLFEEGRFRLNDPISRFIPEFGHNGKQDITIRQLMTHFSGLRPDVDLKQPWSGKETLFKIVADTEKPTMPANSQFVYSDINYEMLGFLVEKLSGMPLEEYAAKNVFVPLGMHRTRFLPPATWTKEIAPTEYDNGVMLRGVVHDPTARRMGGVAGHAGLFSTAGDLAKYAQALLSKKKILSPLTIEKMSTPQQPVTSSSARGLGWDIDTPFSSNRGELLPVGSFGHTGFTGTSLWIDPYTKTYIILLTNSVHPRGDVTGTPKIALRGRVANAVAAALKLELKKSDEAKLLALTGYNEAGAMRRAVSRNAKVLNGIDVLVATEFSQIRGTRTLTRVGLLTNHTGLAVDGKRTIDLLAKAEGIKLSALFAPEHGAVGAEDTTNIGNTVDVATNTPVYSVYGATDASRRPPENVLKELDAVVVDIQDVGARFYTYTTAMRYFLEGCAKAGIEIFVLDRPNPITGTMVQGPVSDIDDSYVNFHSVPARHGMTSGELAQMLNAERKIGAKLTVVQMQGWLRGDWFDSTNQMWVNPSPNMRDLNQATLYTGVAIVEGTNVSVGRGTDTPFELLGAPWIKAREFADYLNGRMIPGVRFVPTSFTPTSVKYEKQLCQGVNMVVTDRQALDAPLLGVELAAALLKMYPNDFKSERLIRLLGNKEAFASLVAGQDPRRVADEWRDGLEEFMKIRSKYLIYK
ncbi:MAG TPA: exo-beta-N-acetylmuramidase NamZ domain-containing protein [Terriglobales bacterium]|nr:exo-beta-N-acetylmuramidase NamZ domain-containing protein [Terriglobales bacterium]